MKSELESKESTISNHTTDELTEGELSAAATEDIKTVLEAKYGEHWLTKCALQYFMTNERWKNDYVLDIPIWDVGQVTILR